MSIFVKHVELRDAGSRHGVQSRTGSCPQRTIRYCEGRIALTNQESKWDALRDGCPGFRNPAEWSEFTDIPTTLKYPPSVFNNLNHSFVNIVNISNLNMPAGVLFCLPRVLSPPV